MTRLTSRYANLAYKCIYSAMMAVRQLGDAAKVSVMYRQPFWQKILYLFLGLTAKVGKPNDSHLRADIEAEQVMFNIVHKWGIQNRYSIIWWSEELGLRHAGYWFTTNFLVITADGCDGTENFLTGKNDSGPCISIFKGWFPQYRNALAAALGLYKENVIDVADALRDQAWTGPITSDNFPFCLNPVAERAYKYQSSPSPVSHRLTDDYTLVAQKSANGVLFNRTGSTVQSIHLVAHKDFALLLDGTDKFNFEQHAMYVFSRVLRLVLHDFATDSPWDYHYVLSWKMNPDPKSMDQATFYMVTNKADKELAIQLYGNK